MDQLQPTPVTDGIVVTPYDAAPLTIEQCIVAWLHEKYGHAESQKTLTAYTQIIEQFREELQARGIDLDGPPHAVALAAQGWAASSKRDRPVAPKTYNQRLAALSSFYHFAIKHQVLSANPIDRVSRRVPQPQDPARYLPGTVVKKGLAQIDKRTLEGKRDYALLSVALATGRRVNELAGLRYGHLTLIGSTCTVRWVRCKGNTRMTDELAEKTTRALYDYLFAVYGEQLASLPTNAPVWISFSDKNHGAAIGYRTIQRICQAHLGTSKMHATRHTWAVTMEKKGAKLTDIQHGLGHKSAHTTSTYLDQQRGYENIYARDLEDEFGI